MSFPTQFKQQIFLIGGVSRSGKSQIAKRLLAEQLIPGISTDIIRHMLRKKYTDEEFEIKSDGLTKFDAESKFMIKYLESLIKSERKYAQNGFWIEGVNLVPEELEQYKNDSMIKIIFLGYDEISPEKKFNNIRKYKNTFDWTDQLSDEELMNSVIKNIERSKQFRTRCNKLGLKYIDTSANFKAKISAAYKSLIA